MRRAFVDANVILRFLTGDPAPMAAQARDLFAAVEQGDLVLVVDEVTIAEVVWVLQSFYGYPAPTVGTVVQELLARAGLEAQDKVGLLTALSLYREKNVGFADALVAVHMERQGVSDVYTFDRHFDRLPGIVRCTPGEAGPS